MKIMYYINSLNIGGAETLVTDYLIELKKAGNDVSVVLEYRTESFLYKRLVDNGVAIYSIFSQTGTGFFTKVRRKLALILFGKKRLNRLVRKINPDVIHIHASITYFNLKTSGFPVEKIFFTFHTDVKRHLGMYGKGYEKKLYAFAQNGMKFVAISRRIECDTRKLLDTENVYYVPNGIRLKEISAKHIDRKEFLGRLGIGENAFIVGHVGRLHEVKNHEKLISSFVEVLKKRPDSYLLSVGEASGAYAEKIKADIEQKGLTEKVKLLGCRSDAPEIMSIFDVFVLPSHMEGLPLVLLEAQAHNIKCVISSAIPKDVICTDKVIVLDKDASDEMWADAIVDGRDLYSKPVGMISAFELSAVMDKHIELYNSAL